jgi:hypothetical protein
VVKIILILDELVKLERTLGRLEITKRETQLKKFKEQKEKEKEVKFYIIKI